MKKYIFVLDAIRLLAMLMDGKRVEGVLYMDEYGKPTFKPYFRKAPKNRPKNELVHQLENGWVKESSEKYKLYIGVYKKLGLARILSIIDRETKEAKTQEKYGILLSEEFRKSYFARGRSAVLCARQGEAVEREH